MINRNNLFLFLSYIDLVQLINSSLLQCLKYNNSDPHIRLVLATWERKIVNTLKGELSFGGRWAPKLTKGPYNSLNWVEGYEIVTDKYTL